MVAPLGEVKEGLRPACLTQVRICEPGAPLQICGEKTVSPVVVAGCCDRGMLVHYGTTLEAAENGPESPEGTPEGTDREHS
jgi:hypothetical protein